MHRLELSNGTLGRPEPVCEDCARDRDDEDERIARATITIDRMGRPRRSVADTQVRQEKVEVLRAAA
jgi:hypothetical protein